MEKGHTFQQQALVKWRAGICFAASAWILRGFDRPNRYFRSLSTPGDLAPAVDGVSWSFHLGLENNTLSSENRIWTNGYELFFSESGSPRSIVALFVEPGILVGKTKANIHPSLFSSELAVQENAGFQWLEMEEYSVALGTTQKHGEHWFCLAVSEEGHTAALHLARKHLETDLDAVRSAEYQKRAPFWDAQTSATDHHDLLNYAVESLVLHLQPPTGSIPFRWSIGDLYSAPAFDLDQLLPLVAAWRLLDRSIARELVKSALSSQNADGSFHRIVSADGQTRDSTPCWPLLAQSVEMASAETDDPEFLEYAMPRLKRYLNWAIEYYRISKDEMVCWPSEQESFIPEVFDQNLASGDIAAFLICEFDAFFNLCNKAPTHTADGDDLMAHAEALKTGLVGFLWSKESGNFRSRYLGGHPIERVTLSSILPLFWPKLPPIYRDELLRQVISARHFRSGLGVPLWMAWESDPTPPPVESRHQNLILLSLIRASARAELQLVSSDWIQALSEQFRQTGGLRGNLRPQDPSESTESSLICPLDINSCILTILAIGAKEQYRSMGGTASPILKWIDNYRTSILTTVVAALVAALFSIVVFYLHKKTMNMTYLQTLAGLAKQHCAEGNYEQAIQIYRHLQEGSGNAASVDIMLANALFKNGEWIEAESLYRQASEKSEIKDPAIHLNLALTLFRQGKFRESRREYASFIEKYGEVYPELTLRARKAIELIEECAPSGVN